MPLGIGIGLSPALLGGLVVPDAPTSLTATQSGADVVLTWTDNATNNTGYYVYRSSDGVSYSKIATIGDVATYTDTNPGSGIWYYCVAAYNAAGETASSAASVVVYLLRVEFTTDDAAPLTNPYTGEIGSVVPVQTDGQFSTSSGKLVFPTQTTAVWGDLGLYDPQQRIRQAGRALLTRSTTTNLGVHFVAMWGATANAGIEGTTSRLGLLITSVNLQVFAHAGTGTVIEAVAANTQYNFAIVLRNTGAFFFIKGGAFAAWTLIWVDNASTFTPLYAKFTNSVGVGTVDSFRAVDLSSPFTTDYGLATQQLAGAQSAGQTFAHEADFVGEFTATTVPSADNIDWHFRIQDATNYWQIRITSAGNIELNEIVAGSPTTRGSAAGVIANGDRIVVVANGTTVKVYETGTLRITYASATSFATATNGELDALGTGGAVSGIVTWPRVPSGAALAALEAV